MAAPACAPSTITLSLFLSLNYQQDARGADGVGAREERPAGRDREHDGDGDDQPVAGRGALLFWLRPALLTCIGSPAFLAREETMCGCARADSSALHCTQGPLLSAKDGTSASLCLDLFTGKTPVVPHLGFGVRMSWPASRSPLDQIPPTAAHAMTGGPASTCHLPPCCLDRGRAGRGRSPRGGAHRAGGGWKAVHPLGEEPVVRRDGEGPVGEVQAAGVRSRALWSLAFEVLAVARC